MSSTQDVEVVYKSHEIGCKTITSIEVVIDVDYSMFVATFFVFKLQRKSQESHM